MTTPDKPVTKPRKKEAQPPSFDIGNARFTWRVLDLMKKADIKSVQELHEKLEEVVQRENLGKLVRSQTYLMVRQAPRRIPVVTLVALLSLFKCDINELIDITWKK